MIQRNHPYIWCGVRIDWQAIKAAIGDQDVLIILNHRVAGILAALWHILEWEATYRTEGYDYADWDYLQRLLSESEENIGSPLPLSDLLAKFDTLTATIAGLQQPLQPVCCDQPYDVTGGREYTDDVLDGIGDVPANIISAGYASGVSDWDGFADYKCMIANVTIDSTVIKLQKLSELVDTGSLIAAGLGAVLAIVGAIWAGPALVLFGGILASAGGAANLFEELLTSSAGDLSQLATDLQEDRANLACAIYSADGPGAAYTAFLDAIEEDIGLVERTLVSLLNVEPEIRALYGGRYDQENVAQDLADAGFVTANYDCSSCVEQPAEFMISWSQGGLYSNELPSTDPCIYVYNNYTPFGQGNPSPSWAVRNSVVSGDAAIVVHSSQLIHRAGKSTTLDWRIAIRRIEFDYGASTIHAEPGADGTVTVFDDSASPDTVITFRGTRGSWSPKSQDLAETLYRDHTTGGASVYCATFYAVQFNNSAAHLVDNLRIWYDISAL